MSTILWVLVVLMVLGWLGGFAFNVAGNLIHALLVLALILAVISFFTGRVRGPAL